MQNLGLFLGNVLAHWVALMSGLVSFCFALWQYSKGKEISAKAFWVVASVFLFIAVNLAWQDEHRNSLTLISEKASAVGLTNSCLQQARVQEAFSKGLQISNQSLQNSLNQAQDSFGKQQNAVNSCVVSLGKMNPILTTKQTVIPIQIEGVNTGAPRKIVFEMIILTNRTIDPTGILECASPLQPGTLPSLTVHGNMRFGGISTITPVNDRTFDLRVNMDGTWTPDNPIHFTALAAGEPGPCTFKPK